MPSSCLACDSPFPTACAHLRLQEMMAITGQFRFQLPGGSGNQGVEAGSWRGERDPPEPAAALEADASRWFGVNSLSLMVWKRVACQSLDLETSAHSQNSLGMVRLKPSPP